MAKEPEPMFKDGDRFGPGPIPWMIVAIIALVIGVSLYAFC